MPRIVFLSNTARNDYFDLLRKLSGLSWEALSQKLEVSRHHLTDIKKGKYSLSSSLASKIVGEYGLNLPKKIKIKDDFWHTKKAGKLGWKRHLELYGFTPATYESRRKGGLNSLKTHKARNTGFFLLKDIKIPSKGIELAELMGALVGDGCLSPRQTSIFLNLKKDRPYASYLSEIIIEMFGINVAQRERVSESTLVLTMSSTKLTSFLNKNGLPIGNKIRQGIDVPSWVYNNESWGKAFLRGLFDTDGCTYVDHHKYKNQAYGYICVALTSSSRKLLLSIYKLLQRWNYKPTLNNERNVLLRRENEVFRFFDEIKPRNIAHLNALKAFMEEYRSGHNGAASKADGDASLT